MSIVVFRGALQSYCKDVERKQKSFWDSTNDRNFRMYSASWHGHKVLQPQLLIFAQR